VLCPSRVPADIIILCKRDPSVLAGEPYRSCQIATVEVESTPAIVVDQTSSAGYAGSVRLECRPITVELVFEYAELIARAFDGTIMSGSEIIEPTESTRLDLADLEVEWRDLDAAIAMDLEATLAVTTRQRIAWETSRSVGERKTG
jgi:hypothetical protein